MQCFQHGGIVPCKLHLSYTHKGACKIVTMIQWKYDLQQGHEHTRISRFDVHIITQCDYMHTGSTRYNNPCHTLYGKKVTLSATNSWIVKYSILKQSMERYLHKYNGKVHCSILSLLFSHYWSLDSCNRNIEDLFPLTRKFICFYWYPTLKLIDCKNFQYSSVCNSHATYKHFNSVLIIRSRWL